MPRTMAQQKSSLYDPAVCELLKIRDFLDGVMVRTDGCYVAGFRVRGTLTYFSDDKGRIEAWEEKEDRGEFLTRIAGVYLIWDPVKHKRTMITSGGPQTTEDRR